MLIRFVSGAPATAAANRSSCVTKKVVWYPPHECPMRPTRSASIIPVSTAAATAGRSVSTFDCPGRRSRYTTSGLNTKYPSWLQIWTL